MKMKEKFRASALSPTERAEDLLPRLTLREKVGQVNQKLYGFQSYTCDGEHGTPARAEALHRLDPARAGERVGRAPKDGQHHVHAVMMHALGRGVAGRAGLGLDAELVHLDEPVLPRRQRIGDAAAESGDVIAGPPHLAFEAVDTRPLMVSPDSAQAR